MIMPFFAAKFRTTAVSNRGTARRFMCRVGLMSCLLAANLSPAEVLITEFMAHNTHSLLDEDGDFSDWIEIQNQGSDAVNLEGWFLTDDPTQLRQWRFPTTNVAAHGYVLVFASGKDRRVPGAQLHTNFKLDSDGEFLALIEP